MKSDRQFGTAMFSVSPVGLGCSRLGSVLGASKEDAEILLRAALDNGVTFFDTSDIYAQGESESLLGKAIVGRRDVIICTKAGKYLPLSRRLLLPFKSLIKQVASRNQAVRQSVRQTRAKGLPTNWDPAYLATAVDRSLRRLRVEHIHVLMLHSPDAEIIRRGDAVGALEVARRAGKIGMIGVSVDDVAAAEAALADGRVGALQVPLHPGSTEFTGIIRKAEERRVAIVAREVLGGPNVISKEILAKDMVAARLAGVTAIPGVSLALVGTTKVNHLLEVLVDFK